jgi:hypothetical protein
MVSGSSSIGGHLIGAWTAFRQTNIVGSDSAAARILSHRARSLGGVETRNAVAAAGSIVALTALWAVFEKLGKAAATGGEKVIINKGSKKLVRNIGKGFRSMGEKVYDVRFSLKGKAKRVLGRTPDKKAAKAIKKAAAEQVKADRKAKTLATA